MKTISSLKWKKQVAYNYDELCEIFSKLQLKNRKLMSIESFCDWDFHKLTMADRYNDFCKKEDEKRVKAIPEKAIPDSVEMARSVNSKFFILYFDDGTQLELYSDKVSKMSVGYNGLKDACNIEKSYDNPNIILKNIIGKRIDIVKVVIDSLKTHTRFYSKKTNNPFSYIIIKFLGCNYELYFNWLGLCLFNKKRIMKMKFKEYKKAIRNKKHFFSSKKEYY